jgi:beta-glucanase (GH16 family)
LGNISGPWKLVFDSEFNGSSLNSSQWSTGTDSASGITQGYDKAIEQECYDPAQVSVGNGELNLAAIAQTCPPAGGTLPYTSGSITTYDHFSYTYGYAEARIWLPGTTSIADWPAFWELGKLYNVSKGEIDILFIMLPLTPVSARQKLLPAAGILLPPNGNPAISTSTMTGIRF